MAKSMVRTTPPKVDKVDTSSAEAPTTQALVAQQGSKETDGNPTNDHPVLPNFIVAESWITCWISSLL
jgi:hypothetical protein